MTQAKKINYAELQSELDTILSDLQREDNDVDATLKQYARGLEIIKLLESFLKTAGNSGRELKASFSS